MSAVKKIKNVISRCVRRVRKIRPDLRMVDAAAICRAVSRKRRKTKKSVARRRGRGRRISS